MNFILASTSTLYGGEYLEYLRPQIAELFEGISELLFIPFARPGGISHDEYTATAANYFQKFNIKVRGLHESEDYHGAVVGAQAYFTGGGNTFLLVKMLHDNNLMSLLKENVQNGKPYLGTSAGSNIGGVNMKTTNDMPIVYPPSFETMGLIPYNINPHYLDADPKVKHNGETRETRLREFLTQNDIPVIGLREGNWLRHNSGKLRVEGEHTTRMFERGREPYEVPPETLL